MFSPKLTKLYVSSDAQRDRVSLFFLKLKVKACGTQSFRLGHAFVFQGCFVKEFCL